jgi:hypothetical protein
MGCHTWCYKKFERSIEEARTIWIKKQTEWIAKWQEITENPYDECRVAYKWEQSYCDKCLLVYKRQLRMVEKGLCNVAVMNHQPEHCRYVEGKGFFIEEGTHDPFRIYGYPNDLLFSYDECIEYISKYEKKKNTKVKLWNNGKTLETFWQNNPNGMICFG